MLYDQINEAVRNIERQIVFEPEYGIILGTGLSGLAEEIDVVHTIPYSTIPHFPSTTVDSHKGEMIFGHLSGKRIVALAGRFHYYEGYSMVEITFPVRVLKFLGIHTLFISNAAGGVKEELESGDLIIVNDHLNFHAENPLRGYNDPRLGLRFPEMLHAYDAHLRQMAMEIALANNIRARYGIYAGLQGPNLETPAEYNFFNLIGASVVGMSSVPEVIVANHMNLKVLMISVVTNKCYPPDEIEPASIESVIAVARSAQPKLNLIITHLLSQL